MHALVRQPEDLGRVTQGQTVHIREDLNSGSRAAAGRRLLAFELLTLRRIGACRGTRRGRQMNDGLEIGEARVDPADRERFTCPT